MAKSDYKGSIDCLINVKKILVCIADRLRRYMINNNHYVMHMHILDYRVYKSSTKDSSLQDIEYKHHYFG